MAEPMNLSLTQAAHWLNTQMLGDEVSCSWVESDTRKLQPGSLFVALTGPNFDGHDFVNQAVEKGAVAVMVARPVACAVPQLVVDDTRLALGRLAAAWRQQFDLPLVAVTGSNGKTTVKEMLAAIFSTRGSVLATRGNLNNDIGMPLTLLNLRAGHRFAVIEMGANHPGEIAYLTRLAAPTVAMINNANAAHLEGFGSLEGVARAKGEIFQGIVDGGLAVYNGDDNFAPLWRELNSRRRSWTFGLDKPADVRGEFHAQLAGGQLLVHTPLGDVDIQLNLPGRHNAMNALAASACALGAGVSLADIKLGLEDMQAVAGRTQPKRGIGGALLLDDTYNANPNSLRAGMAVLAAYPGTRLLALGDMGELGADSDQLHAEAGREAAVLGLDGLYCLGKRSLLACQAFGAKGRHFEDHEAMAAALREVMTDGVTVLVKGSRSMRMERVVNALLSS